MNNMCIYTKQPFEDALMTSGDHVFLAAIGGIKKLPKSYVSHEVNNFFSKLEQGFSRDSIISMNRQFEGPGKRGSLNEKKATKSHVFIMESESVVDIKEKYSLGYVKLAKPYTLNHFTFSFDENIVTTSLNPYLLKGNISPEEALSHFAERAKKSKEYIFIKEEKLPNTLALFGELDKNGT